MNGWEKMGVGWAFVSILFWGIVSASSGITTPFLYSLFWIGIIGTIVYIRREKIQKRINQWKISPFPKFVLLGYGMVVFEEVFAAFANHVMEGFDLSLFLTRILQFWSFNILAFTGLILAWYFLYTRYDYSFRHGFMLAGAYGLVAEKTYLLFFQNPLTFIFWIPLVFLSYGLILTPSFWATPLRGRKELKGWKKTAAGIVLPLLLAAIISPLIPIFRKMFPDLFPPPHWTGG
jgi:hypothetical protein